MNSGIEPLTLSREEARKVLKISLRHLDSLTKAGVIPCVRLGGRVLYSVEALREWVKQRAGDPAGV